MNDQKSLIQQYLDVITAKEAEWKKKCEEYQNLKSRLLSGTEQEISAPVSKVGHFARTVAHDKVLVLLGDNWLAERSIAQALDIADRRIAYFSRCLDDLQKEKAGLQGEITSDTKEPIGVTQISKETEGVVEIREEYDPLSLPTDWRAPRKGQRRIAHKPAHPKKPENIEVPKKASELRSAVQLRMEKPKPQSLDSDDDEIAIYSEEMGSVSISESSSVKSERKKSVTWGADTVESIPIINEEFPSPKPILRNKNASSPVDYDDPSFRKGPVIVESSEVAFSGQIVEKVPTANNSEQVKATAAPRPLSKFKQSRCIK